MKTDVRTRDDGRLRILCLIPAMGPGGAERTMSHLIAHLSPRHELTLMTWEDAAAEPFYPLPSGVTQVRVGLLGGTGLTRLLRLLARHGAVRQQVRRQCPDVVLSFMDTMNISAIIMCLGSGVPVVISERTDPAHHRIGPLQNSMRRLLYPLANTCVVQTARVAAYFNRAHRPNIAVIPNPVPVPVRAADPQSPNGDGRFRVIAMGRLDDNKGFATLLAAFAQLAPENPDWDLVIFGEGPNRATLEDQRQRLGLDRRVFLPGLTTDPVAMFADSHIMAFPSLYEGFPNALAEALATGLPAVAHEAVSGVEDMIVDDVTGLLVRPESGPHDLAAALARLMRDAALRERLGREARRHMAQWSPERILGEWENLIIAQTRRDGHKERSSKEVAL